MDATSCKRQLEIEIPADVVSREAATVAQKFARMARVPGFRPGKAPVSVIRQRYAEDIKSEVLQALIPEYIDQEMQKQKLAPVTRPSVEKLEFEEGKPLRFRAIFEVLPEFELKEYKGLEVKIEPLRLTDEDVNRAIADLRERHATYTVVEGRPLADGDFAVLSLVGIETKPAVSKAAPFRTEDVMCHIGADETLEEFNRQLRGASVGDERRFEVIYPDDYPDERLHGKTIAYHLRVKGIKQKQLPEPNDDFAKDVGEFASLEELEKKIRSDMESARDRREKEMGKDKLLEALVAAHDFPVPEALVERQMDVRLERTARSLIAQGVDPRAVNVDWVSLRRRQQEGALTEVKAGLILDRVADQENLEVSEEELNRELDDLARRSGESTSVLRARLTKQGALDRISSRLRNEKALDRIYESARIRST
ncbi:MAG TPA: trigger factor [Candidatus Acidoferrales bacterium]